MHRLLNVLLYTFDKHVNYTIVKKYVYMGGNIYIYIYTCIIPLSPLGSPKVPWDHLGAPKLGARAPPEQETKAREFVCEFFHAHHRP